MLFFILSYLYLLPIPPSNAYPNALAPTLVSQNLTLPLLLSTSNLTLSIPRAGTICFPSGSPTTVEGCRPALNFFRDFPNYSTIQPFQEGRSPVINNDNKPPFLIFARGATCAIEIACGNARIVDAFSFKEARALAMDIIEDCQEQGGHGGWAPIGRRIGWRVRVIGVEFDGVGTGLGLGNGTVVGGGLVEES